MWSSPLSKVFLASVTQPYSEDLWHFVFLLFRQLVVELQRTRPLHAAGCIVMRVPIAARYTDPSTSFLYEIFASLRIHLRNIAWRECPLESACPNKERAMGQLTHRSMSDLSVQTLRRFHRHEPGAGFGFLGHLDREESVLEARLDLFAVGVLGQVETPREVAFTP